MGKGVTGRQGRLGVQLALTIGFFFVEIIVGHLTNSIALVADSFHMLSDIFSLLIGIYAVKAAKRTISEKNTYGWIRAEVLGALVNGIFLLALCFSIVVEAIQRFFHVEEISDPKLVLIVGGAGLFINLVGLALFAGHGHSHGGGHGHSHGGGGHGHGHGKKEKRKDKHAHGHGHSHGHGDEEHAHEHEMTHVSPAQPPAPVTAGEAHVDTVEVVRSPAEGAAETAVNMSGHNHGGGSGMSLNMHGVFLHVLGDALGSVAVMISATVIWLTDWSGRYYMDPMMSLLFTALIIFSTVPLVKSSALILLQGIPKSIDVDALREQLCKMPGVVDIHELHVWQLADEKFIATVHVTCDTQQNYMTLAALMKALFHSIGIHSTTIQPEFVQSVDEALDDDKLCLIDCGTDDNDTCKTNVCCTTDKHKLVRRKNRGSPSSD